MAQPSKKDHIAQSARALFFKQGIKGTSVDMVVKVSKVSKPTVYNHFPDKSALFYHVVTLWLTQQPPFTYNSDTEQRLIDEVQRTHLTDEALTFYKLIIGEGNRAVEAVALFKQQFDHAWRSGLQDCGKRHGLDTNHVEEKVSHYLLNKLMA